MQRLLQTVIQHFRALVFAIGLMATLAQAAHAQSEPIVIQSCAPVERELEAARAALEQTRNELQAARDGAAATAKSAQAALERARRELEATQNDITTCHDARRNLCASVGSFARGVVNGRLNTGGLGQCVDAQERTALSEQLSGWSNASTALAQFGSYSAGESDNMPRLGPLSGARVEKLVARLFAAGNGSPLVYRRLLIEALELVAPRTWGNLRKKPGQVERWFGSDDPLEDALVEEARTEVRKRLPEGRGPAPLTTALELISAYEILANCNTTKSARDCKRASELRGLLESSGPLVARRRMQDVWATECSSVTSATMQNWLTDFPRGMGSDGDTQEIAQVVQTKLLTCFLRDATAGESFSAWLAGKLPEPDNLNTKTIERLHALESAWQTGSPTDVCARAVRALQGVAPPSECAAPPSLVQDLKPWAELLSSGDEGPLGLRICNRYARELWDGASATIDDSFPVAPTVDDAIRLIEGAPTSNVKRLRELCRERVGSGETFSRSLRELSSIGKALGENPAAPPWVIDAAAGTPVEDRLARRANETAAWLGSLTRKNSACALLELNDERCKLCREARADAHYDCAQLIDMEASWERRTRSLLLKVAGVLGLLLLFGWAIRLRKAKKTHGVWLEQTQAHLASLGLSPIPDRLRYVFPSRMSRLLVKLPQSAGWERLGPTAIVTRAGRARIQERDVNRAGALGQQLGASLALLVHDENVSPDLGAVRAMLEWAARGGNKAVHVLPLPWSRLKWSQGALDLLELAEEASLRSNPFEVRGRVTSSSQFFDRERLVSGLLASAQAGHFCVVTGLRRFGKSSLALEVGRRLPGPSSYVDLAGFHHEIRFSQDPADAVDAILRFLCLRLVESARSRTRRPIELEVPTGKMDAATLTAWFNDFLALLSEGSGSPPPVLLILDEIEQAIGAAKDLEHALDVFAILVGRLRNSLPGNAQPGRGRVGVLFSSALHPLLWSPLGTLAHQSLIGCFQYVSVSCLPEEAAASMMRGLGARQGIRFKDEALNLLVQQSQGVPLLVRRLGTAVLELYDPDRARQGALGAVEIGVEGVRAALEREEAEGSPLRVWIESEIAEPKSPGGVVLRALARVERLSAVELRHVAARAFREQFDVTGLTRTLTQEEVQRRTQEAAGVSIRMLGDSGLLRAHGDPTEPEAYELPDGVIRRVLRAATVVYDDSGAPSSLTD